MRYLSNRDQFLKESKFTGLQKYEKTPYSGEEFKLYENENAGPFVNDIGWNDSLLGRFINHLVRKAKIAIGKMRLKGLIRQLNDTFEEIVSRGRAAAMSDEDRLQIIRLQVYAFFHELIQGVENGENIGVLIRLTEGAIDALESTEDFDDKDSLMEELENFLEFLRQFDENEGGTAQGQGDEEGEEGQGQGDEEGSESGESSYGMMVKNLKALSLILLNYKKVKLVDDLGSKSQKKTTYTTKQGDTLKKIEVYPENTKKLKSNDILSKNQMVTQNGVKKKFSSFFKPGIDKTTQDLPAGIVLVLENSEYLLEGTAVAGSNKTGSQNPIGSGAGQDRSKVVKSGEDHLTQAFTKLKTDIEVLISSKNKGIGIDYNSLNDLLKNSNDYKAKKNIKELYSEIKRYLVGDKKGTLQDKDDLYKESLNISVPKERVIIAEKIARFAKRALQFKGTNLEGGLGELKVPLKDFISSLDEILNSKVKVEENRLFKYDTFTMLLKEADGDNENQDDDNEDDNEVQSNGNEGGSGVSQRVREWFNKNCKGVISFTIEEAEAKRLRVEFDKVRPTDFVIDGFDPIIQIIRIFNRAYKIYTTRIISKRSQKVTGGTSGPSAGTAMEYMPLGSGGGEPYRHIKTFNIWEDAVFDILGNREYQEIFDKKTGLRVGDEIRPEKGVALRKFIFDLLDGSKLYGSGGSSNGIQSQFLEEYFGEVDDKSKNAVSEVNDGEGGSEAAGIQSDINGAAIEVSMSRDNMRILTPSVGYVFTITSERINEEASDNTEQYTFIVTGVKDGYIRLLYFSSIGAFLPMFQNAGNIKTTNIKGDFQGLNIYKSSNNGNRLLKHYTKIKREDFVNLFKVGSSITLNHVVGPNYNSLKKDNLKISAIYWLAKKVDGRKSPFNLEGDGLTRAQQSFDRGSTWMPNIDNNAVVKRYAK